MFVYFTATSNRAPERVAISCVDNRKSENPTFNVGSDLRLYNADVRFFLNCFVLLIECKAFNCRMSQPSRSNNEGMPREGSIPVAPAHV